ncbi:MAG TPA: glutamine amidotransferase [Vicinamibacterales bacterium]|nr:glutamine amidotransferase [Vicinamibacterales bacterium]
MFEKLFQFLFEYRPHVFQQGDFRFAPPAGAPVAALVIAAALAIAFVSYRLIQSRVQWRERAVLGALRIAALGLILFCIFRPVLIVKAAVTQQNVVGILIDDSRSMQLPATNQAAGSRADLVRSTFANPDSAVIKALSDRFLIRTFRFSSSTARVATPGDLTFTGTQTRLANAIESARQELAGLPVSGLVLVTDGADTTDATVADALLASKAEALPVFTVGVGQETLSHDIQVGRVSTPRTALKGTSLLVDAVLTQTGYAGQTVTLDVEDEGRIVGSQPVRLPADGDPVSVRVRFTATEAGPRIFRLRVAPQPGEVVTQNNQRDVQIDIRDRKERILYFEGEPRFEMKFARQAIKDDPNLELVTLQRTAENKYLRLDIDAAGVELAAGFPKTREELFAYRGLVLGSIEASAFSADQLRMIAEYVDVRGGGLLFLGGPRAFAEGGYAGTPVEDVMPVLLGRSAGAFAALKIQPTRAGQAHAVTQLGDTEQASADRWKSMPSLSTVNQIEALKPGATALLAGLDERRRERVVLAFERYGRGKSIAFPVQDSWHWQMDAAIRVEDQTHENFWRQLLRWLVDGVPDAVEVRTLTDRVEPGQPVALTADVVDPRFVELNDANVVAHVTSPSGKKTAVSLQWTGERSGQYRAAFDTAEPGWYQATLDATREGKSVGGAVAHVRAVPDDAEYFDAAMHAPLLKRIAQDTGGRFYPADATSTLADDLKYSGRGVTAVEERELWHMPALLIALVCVICAEWGLRRYWRLA